MSAISIPSNTHHALLHMKKIASNVIGGQVRPRELSLSTPHTRLTASTLSLISTSMTMGCGELSGQVQQCQPHTSVYLVVHQIWGVQAAGCS